MLPICALDRHGKVIWEMPKIIAILALPDAPWIKSIGLDEVVFGTHTMRRTNASLISQRKRSVGKIWRMDETYIRVKGE